MDQNQTYTLRRSERKPVNGAKTFILVAAVAAFAAALFAGVHLGRQRALRETDVTAAAPSAETAAGTTSAEAPSAQTANEVYPVGLYTVNTGNYTLLLRKDHSADAEEVAELINGDEVTVEEVLYDAASEDPNYLYWGKATVDGAVGWLPMFYLSRSSEPVSESAAVSAPGITEPQTGEDGGSMEPGSYTVDSGEDTVRLRQEPKADAEVVAILSDGDGVTVRGSETDADGAVWAQVTVDGKSGYLPAELLKEAE